jgi:hypothetical protein
MHDDRGGASLKRGGNIVTSIAAKSGARKEDITLLDLT